MMARSEKVARWLLLAGIIILIAWALGGCAQEPKIIRETVPVISSKPYRYLKPHPTEDKLSADTLSQIARHNTAHALVKKKEAEAAK
jgi:hypothetical protein